MISSCEFKHLLGAARPRCVKCASLATSVEWTTADGCYRDEAEAGFFVGRLQGTKGSAWQLTAIDVASSYAWTELVTCPRGSPSGEQTSKLARRVCSELAAAGWRLEGVLTDNGREFRSGDFRSTLAELGVRHTLIRAGRPQTNGAVEALHRLILEECWRPTFARCLHGGFTGLKCDLERYVDDYNLDRPHHGCLTRGRIPADIVYGARKVRTR